MAAIDLINLTKFFGSVKAVNDLTLTISDKEFVALLRTLGLRQDHDDEHDLGHRATDSRQHKF